MTHGSLYSGIGGWLLAAGWAGIENIFTCEINKFCNKVLDKHFPNTDRHHDIKETDFSAYAGRIDILSTSDPCQPFSFAGKRGGKADDRYLWPQTIRVIREIKPSYVVFENVPGFISLGFETVASDLEAEGYWVESFVIPACGVGAWHRRDRLWVIAYTMHNGNRQQMESGGEHKNGSFTKEQEGWTQHSEQSYELDKLRERKGEDVPDTERIYVQGQYDRQGKIEFRGGGWWTTEPNVGRVAHGIPSRVDRLKSLGNSIVPQIAYIIFEAIKQAEKAVINKINQ